ncbi:MAG TPA: multicopper oxidase domain-containing protein [Pyrinomonadaceae bacterium]|nr:multicopper oxidase domain-containing protein [Pyrinomonadaceae bacterium]
MAALTLLALPTQAQETVPCPPQQQDLLTIPELASQNGVLRGTVMLSDEKEAIPFRFPPQSRPGDSGAEIKCQPQYVRILRGLNATPAPPAPAPGAVPNPMPGPTLRARVGDIIQITFVNTIYPNHFGRSIDNGDTGVGCDQPVPPGDTFPDCFHGSSTGNIHYHGTHTNPNNTGDNVFIEVRPLPRDNQGNLTTSPEKVTKSFDKFFSDCATQLKGSALTQWPTAWADMPSDYTDLQKELLKAYDDKLKDRYGVPPAKQLWPINKAQLDAGGWPQYYIGAFPYCFRLPEYIPGPGMPPAHSMAGMTMGAPQGNIGTLAKMGQAPGTHWYHAHKHGSTAINVANGMTGAFIIEGPYDDELNQFYGAGWTRTQPLLVINQLGVTPNLLRGGQGGQGGQGATDKGPDFSVNGQIKPVIKMQPGEVQLWRIVNTSGRAATYFPRPLLGAGYEWRQLAQDGVQFNNTNYQEQPFKDLLLAPGNRADMLVKAKPCPNRAPTCTYNVLVQNEVDPSDLASANKLTLVSIQVSGPPIDPNSPRAKFIPNAPQFPAFLGDIKNSEITGGKVMRFSSTSFPGIRQHMIDGVKFDGRVGALVQLNKAEEWKVINETYGAVIAHPFHIHINPFQVVELFDPNEILKDKNGKPVIDPVSKKPVNKYVFQGGIRLLPGQCYLNPLGNSEDWKPCGPTPENKDGIWWDVFPIPSGRIVTTMDMNTKKSVTVKVPGYFKMRSRFVDYPGYYVLHCHILAHEDRGMMTVVEVSPAPMPYVHN